MPNGPQAIGYVWTTKPLSRAGPRVGGPGQEGVRIGYLFHLEGKLCVHTLISPYYVAHIVCEAYGALVSRTGSPEGHHRT